jgi:hypothetical protein
VPEDQRVPFWNFHILQDVAKVSATDVDLLQQLQLSKKTGAHWDYLQNMTRVSPDEYKGQIQMITLAFAKSANRQRNLGLFFSFSYAYQTSQ